MTNTIENFPTIAYERFAAKCRLHAKKEAKIINMKLTKKDIDSISNISLSVFSELLLESRAADNFFTLTDYALLDALDTVWCDWLDKTKLNKHKQTQFLRLVDRVIFAFDLTKEIMKTQYEVSLEYVARQVIEEVFEKSASLGGNVLKIFVCDTLIDATYKKYQTYKVSN
jgi:hypothetical protein